MSFPYTTTSPPPTSGALTVVDKANLSSAPYGGGGGGGTVGPNLAVSSITFNPGGAGINFPNSNDLNANIYAYQDAGNMSTTSLGINFVSGYADKRNNSGGVWSVLNMPIVDPYYGDFAAGRFVVLGNNSGTSVSVPVIDADTDGQMSFNAVSTINFSTPTLLLNGAPIGSAAIPANLATSTLKLSMTEVPSPAYSLAAGVDGGGNTFLQCGGASTNVTYTSIKTLDADGNPQSYVQTLCGLNDGQVAFGTTGGYLSKVELNATGVSISSLTSDNLTVSSINGQAPGISAGPNPSVSTLSVMSSITVDVGGEVIFLNDNVWDSQGLSWKTDATATSTLRLQPAYMWDEAVTENVGLGIVLTTSTTNAYQNLGVNKLFLQTGYGAAPGAVIMDDPLATGTAYISSIRVSSINGGAPAFTSYNQQDIGDLFSRLFAANPALSTIVY